MDVNNAFRHKDLHKEVYMHLLQGFSISHPNKVCQLCKSLYGLCQSPRNWFAKLSTARQAYGFLHSHGDHTLFTYNKDGIFLSLLVYIDDLILAGNNNAACLLFKKYLDSCFQIKDLGPLKYFLGLEASRGPTGLFLSQRKYVLDLLSDSGLIGSKPTDSLMEQNHTLALTDGPLLEDPSRYRCRRLVSNIWMQLTVYGGTLRVIPDSIFYFARIVPSISLPTVIQTGPTILSLAAQLQATLFSWAHLSFHGKQRNNPQFHGLLQRPNTGQWPPPLLSWFG